MARIIHTPISFEKPIDAYYHTRKPDGIPNSIIVDSDEGGNYIVKTPSSLVFVSTYYSPLQGICGMWVARLSSDGEPQGSIEMLDEVFMKDIGGFEIFRSAGKAVSKHLTLVEKIQTIFVPHAVALPTIYNLNEMRHQNVPIFEI